MKSCVNGNLYATIKKQRRAERNLITTLVPIRSNQAGLGPVISAAKVLNQMTISLVEVNRNLTN
jgi:hypothetical protein